MKGKVWMVMTVAVMLSLTATVWAGGPAADEKPAAVAASQPVVLDGGATPKDALVKLVDGVEKLDIDKITGVVAPEYQNAMRTMMTAAKKIKVASDSAKKTVTDKIGAETAEELFKGMDFSMRGGPLDKAVKDGKIDWERVTIKEDGDKATVLIDGELEDDMALRKVEGKWYVAPVKMSADKMNEMAAQSGSMTTKMVTAFETFEKAVKEGKVTKENAQAEYLKALAGAMGAGGGADDDDADEKDAPAPKK